MSQLSLRKGFAFAAALLLVGAAIAVAVATHGSGRPARAHPEGNVRRPGRRREPEGHTLRAQESVQSGPRKRSTAHKAYPANEIPWQANVATR